MLHRIAAATLGVVLVAAPTTSDLPTPPRPEPTLELVPVIRVIDRGTIVVGEEQSPRTIRLLGVDAPGTTHASSRAEEFGREASEFLDNLLRGESVWLEPGERKTRDRDGRELAYVFRAPDGLFVNLEILRQGFGHGYAEVPFRHMELFAAYGRFARDAGKGMWRPEGAALARPEEDMSPPVTAPEPVTVYVTRTGTTYHLAGCPHLTRGPIPISLEEAKRRSSPCSGCNPPRE